MGNEMNTPAKCSDSDCHPNATCGEFGGYQQCTCKEGFAGNGSYCEDIDECHDHYTNNCHPPAISCINAIGTYSCECFMGFKYDDDFGCVDIDECAHTLLNDCHPRAICANLHGSYTCTCAYGYYGNGTICEDNECEQSEPCEYTEDCFKYPGSYSCFDPCSNYATLENPWRSPSNTYQYGSLFDWFHSDDDLSGWYRFEGRHDQKITEHCVPAYSCGTESPMWLNGSHPAASDGVVSRTTCASGHENCCRESTNIFVKMCPQGFYVYKLEGTQHNMGYCTESEDSCLGIDCALDEECGTINGVVGCYCKESSSTTHGSVLDNSHGYLTPQVSCGQQNIKVRFSKCLVEKLGYHSSSVQLRDSSCKAIIERENESYLTLETRPEKGHCGTQTSMRGNNITYVNTAYLTSHNSEGMLVINEFSVDFSCTYPLNMETNLLSGISSFTASASINVGGISNYTVKMGIFQDSDYTTQYPGPEVCLDPSATLYVGFITSGPLGSSRFVLIMDNCYVAPTPDQHQGMRNDMKYDIIKNRCPNTNEPTISILENGQSLKGSFSFEMFKFVEGFDHVYLHCEIGLCDTSRYNCSANCPFSKDSGAASSDNFQHVSLGPINRKVKNTSSSDRGAASLDRKLLLLAVVLLMLLI
ncbi:uromodulin-like [Hyperolius riggenbachi]|uniref:uromodulin-like n=1 Tax=Hyperolius riggenbachi TaxID=752182 RepID=UPI0035A334D2